MIGEEPVLKRTLRRSAQALARVVLRARATPLAANRPGIALLISPHQDDDVLGCGGFIAQQRLAGRDVHVAYLTDGSASHANHPTLTPPLLAQQREGEARAALRVLGVESTAVHFFGGTDGTLDRLDPAARAQLAEKIEQLLRAVQPTEIFLPAHDDGSSEHEAAFRIFQDAWRTSGIRAPILEYAIWAWWSPRLLWRKILRGQRVWRCEFHGYEFLKAQAIAAHRSQIEASPPWTRPVLAAEFYRQFLAPEEFFFEI